MMISSDSVAVKRSPLRSWPETLALITELYEFFEELGVSRLGATRIGAYRDALDNVRHAIESDDFNLPRHQAEDVIETMVELEQFRLIMRAAKRAKRPSIWTAAITQLAGGPRFATGETDAASPRDKQFECFIGAVGALAGYDVTFDEPDVRLNDGAISLVVAAKRLRSLGSLEKRCRKAAKQIKLSNLPGIIALDLTHALHHRWCLRPASREEALDVAKQSLDQFLEGHEAHLRRWVNRRAAAVLVSSHLPAVIGEPTKPALMTTLVWTLMVLTDDAAAITPVLAFLKRCGIGPFGEGGDWQVLSVTA